MSFQLRYEGAHFQCRSLLILQLVTLLNCNPTQLPAAESFALVDDFNQSAELKFISRTTTETLPVENVGDFSLTRTLGVSQSGNGIVGAYDANITRSGALHAQLDEVRPRVGLDDFGISDFAVDYRISEPLDISVGGQYDAIKFDFLFLRGPRQPDRFRATMWGGLEPSLTGVSLSYSLISPTANNNRFTILMPFENFTTRGGSTPGIYDPAFRFNRILIDFLWTAQTGQFDWSMQLDRISLVNTASVPEPKTVVLAFALIGMFVVRRKFQ